MNHLPSFPSDCCRFSVRPQQALPLVLPLAGLLLAALLSGCGGGSGAGDPASQADPAAEPIATAEPAVAFASGAIDGFGSIVVNGVHYDERSAVIRDDDGKSVDAGDLKLGMVVDVSASLPVATTRGTLAAVADAIRIRSEIDGPLTAIDPPSRTLMVLGQSVQVTDTTVFTDGLRGGFGALAVGQRLEIHGFATGFGRYTASRIEREDPDDDPYKVRGLVGALDPAGRTFRLGELTVAYGGLAAVPADLADGAIVRVRLPHAADADGRWAASRLETAAAGSGGLPGNGTGTAAAGVRAEIEGPVQAVLGGGRYRVDGVVVETGAARRMPAELPVGASVEVEGWLRDGVLHADTVELERGPGRDDGFEIEGTITAVDAAATTFQVRGVTVDASGARFEDGTAARLQVGARVEIRGRLAADGATLAATVIDFD
ncbi:MAG: DUF5666 domain-containing protein [Lautropia sp.]